MMGDSSAIRLSDVQKRLLSQHPGVAETVVTARMNDQSIEQLIAYVVPTPGGELITFELRRFLAENLPENMVPSAIVVLEDLPLDENRNVDRDALPPPEEARPESKTAFAPARDPVEVQLAAIWQALLRKRPIGMKDDFFELGGHSLLAAQLFSAIEERFGKKVSLDFFFERPTIEHLARAIRQKAPSASSSCLVGIQPSGTKPPFFAIAPSASPRAAFAQLSRLLGEDQPFYGLKPPAPDGRKPPSNWFQQVAIRYVDAMEEIQPEGPYFVGGRFFGGFVAFEVAQELIRRNHAVGLLVLMDVGAPLTRSSRFYADRLRVGIKFRLLNLRRHYRGRPPIEYAIVPNHPIRFDLVQVHKRATATYDALVWDANLRGGTNYTMRAYAGRITLIQSSVFDPSDSLERAWSKLALGGVGYYSVPCGQDDMLREPAVQILAKELKMCLSRAQNG